MSPLFYLASDFIDRMTNPRYGTRENEEYTLKFAELLRDEGSDRILREEAGRISDVNTLTPYGWIWLLNWVRSAKIRLDEDLLSGLIEQWHSPIVMALIIDVATQASQQERSLRVLNIYQLGNEWLRALLTKCVTIPENEGGEGDSSNGKSEGYREAPDMSFAQNVLVALLQSGSIVSLNAAAAFLWHRWTGQGRLLEFFYQRLALLDEETRVLWNENLDPPRFENIG